jgi:hypothetical protein
MVNNRPNRFTTGKEHRYTLNRRLGGAQSRVDASEKRKITHTVQVFGFVGTDHLRTKIIINDETLEQVSQFTYLGCSIS